MNSGVLNCSSINTEWSDEKYPLGSSIFFSELEAEILSQVELPFEGTLWVYLSIYVFNLLSRGC